MATLAEIEAAFKKNADDIIAANKRTMDEGFKGIKDEMKVLKKEFKDVKTTVSEGFIATNARVDSLELKLKEKDNEIAALKRDVEVKKRKNNILIFNLAESEKSREELIALIVSLLQQYAGPDFSVADLNDVFRLGKPNGKCRPVLVSFLSFMKLQTVISNKQRFREANIGISQDYPKDVMEERKKLQPMISSLNKAGKKAYLKFDGAYVDGRKLTKEEIDVEMQKLDTAPKRNRSPEDDAAADSALSRRARIPKLKLGNYTGTTPKRVQRNNEDEVSPLVPYEGTPSTPSRLFPVFELPKTVPENTLTSLPGGTPHSAAYAYRSDK